ncbi:hypothetical protein GGI42DRAFT_182224 [Trichoderma sp. SZMC 28013]
MADEAMNEIPEALENTFPDPLPPLDDSSPLKHRTLNYRLLPQNALGSAPRLTLIEWRLGKPLHDGFFADYFKQPCHFTRPPIDTFESLDFVLRDADKRNRKRLIGSTIVIDDFRSSSWIAALVGLQDTHQLFT